ncbi:MAG: exodeoxyribonuclease VII small subunit [Pseudomonadota bacterium]|nr:exodeoxyribonuclease VII small subunit [Pseudomonadota bacterium]|tara:strand:+ start:2140 stop:2355 length:216 start_codon:yes stop_codon:yes gene_type:complete
MTKKNIDFEKSLSKLESIIEVLESENVSLEESVKKFEEGISLVKSCQKQLKDAELKVNKLLDDGSLEIVED